MISDPFINRIGLSIIGREEKNKFTLIKTYTTMKQFTSTNFNGDCTIDEDFEPTLVKMNEIAGKYNITVQVISSFRMDTNVKGAIVTPATHSNHLIGHAIDCNLVHAGQYYNSAKMQTDTGVVRQFINELKAEGIRWGGDFKKPDPVHFDDGLNLKDMPTWIAKYNALHS
jgi:hypothetical protein